MQQFSMWGPCISPLKVFTWGPHGTPVCLPPFVYVGPMCDYLSWVQCRLPLMGHTSVCNNFPCGANLFCLSKYPHGAHMELLCACHRIIHIGPMCDCLLWGQYGLPLMGPTRVCKKKIPLETPSSQVMKMLSQTGVQWQGLIWKIYRW